MVIGSLGDLNRLGDFGGLLSGILGENSGILAGHSGLLGVSSSAMTVLHQFTSTSTLTSISSLQFFKLDTGELINY